MMTHIFLSLTLFVSSSLTQWITINPAPGGVCNGGMASGVLGATVFVTNWDFSGSYDTSTGSWSQLPPMPTRRSGPIGTFVFGAEFLVVSGLIGPTKRTDVEAYRVVQGTWITRTSAPTARSSTAGDGDGMHLWVAGDAGTITEEYDANADSWTTRRPMPTPRINSGGAYTHGRFVVASGSNLPEFRLVESYHPPTDTWTTVSSLPSDHPRVLGACAVRGRIFVLGGASTSVLHRYTVDLDVWTTLESRPTSTWGSAIAVADNFVMLAAYLYTPASPSEGLTAHAYQTEFVMIDGWTTVSSFPNWGLYGGAAAASGTDVVYVAQALAAKYSTTTVSWTTLPSRPVTKTANALEATAYNTVLAVGGATPTSADVHLLHLGTHQWTTGSPLPHVRHGLNSASSGTVVWAMGGTSTTSTHAYNVVHDVWTAKRAMPTARLGASSAYCTGYIAVSGEAVPVTGIYTVTEIYTVNTDTWSTASPSPIAQQSTYSRVGVFGDHVYFLGNPTVSEVLHQYTPLIDRWTTLTSAPTGHETGSMAIASNGLLVVVGNQNLGTVHTFYVVTPLSSASLYGDPVVIAFDGRQHHVELWPSVFNLVTTPTLVVNALVDHSPTLPPDESMVMMMVGIVYRSPKNGKIVQCACSASVNFSCSCREGTEGDRASPASTEVFLMDNNAGIVVVTTSMTVEVLFVHQTTVVVENGVHSVFPNSCFLNIHVFGHSPPSALHSRLRLSAGLFHLDAPLLEYEVESGSLFATEVPASVGIFAV